MKISRLTVSFLNLRWLFIALCLLLLVAGIDNTLNQRWQISADMAHILKTGDQASLINQWNQSSMASFDNQFILLLHGTLQDRDYPNEDRVDELLNNFEQQHDGLFSAVDNSDALQDLVQTLQPYRYNYASTAAMAAAVSDTAFLRYTQQQLYNSHLLPLPGLDRAKDPLNQFHAHLSNALRMPDTDLFANRVMLLADNSDAASLVLNFRIQSSGLDLATQEQVVTRVDALERQLQRLLPGFELLRLGPVFHARYAAQSMKQDISLIATGSTLGIILLFSLVFARPQALLLSMTGIGFGFVTAFVVCNWLYQQLHFIVLVFGASLIGVSVDFSLHFFCRYWTGTGNTGASVFKRISAPLQLSLLSSALGYMCLSFSGLASLQQIAVFSSVGLVGAWLFLGFCAGYLPGRHTSPGLLVHLLDNVARVTGSLRAGKRVVTTLSLVLGAASIAYLCFASSSNDNPRLMYNASHKLIDDARRSQQLLEDFDGTRYILVSGKNEAHALAQLNVLQTHLAEWQGRGLLDDYASILDYIPSARVQQQNFAFNQRIYAPGGLLVTSMLQLGFTAESLNNLFGDLAASGFQLISPARVAAASAITQAYWFSGTAGELAIVRIATSQPVALQQAIVELNNASINYIDRAASIAQVLKHIRENALAMLAVAYGLILLVFAVFYRSLAGMKLVFVPLLSSLLTLALLSTGAGISAFHVFGLYLVLGLGIDYAVFYQACRHRPDPSTLAAICMAAFTSLLSFGLLAMSDTAMIGDFGKTLALGIALNLLATLLLFASTTPGQPDAAPDQRE